MKHLIENCYFTVDNPVLIQANGIPMRLDRAPFLAILYAYVLNYMSDLIAFDKVRACHFYAIKPSIN